MHTQSEALPPSLHSPLCFPFSWKGQCVCPPVTQTPTCPPLSVFFFDNRIPHSQLDTRPPGVKMTFFSLLCFEVGCVARFWPALWKERDVCSLWNGHSMGRVRLCRFLLPGCRHDGWCSSILLNRVVEATIIPDLLTPHIIPYTAAPAQPCPLSSLFVAQITPLHFSDFSLDTVSSKKHSLCSN